MPVSACSEIIHSELGVGKLWLGQSNTSLLSLSMYVQDQSDLSADDNDK